MQGQERGQNGGKVWGQEREQQEEQDEQAEQDEQHEKEDRTPPDRTAWPADPLSRTREDG